MKIESPAWGPQPLQIRSSTTADSGYHDVLLVQTEKSVSLHGAYIQPCDETSSSPLSRRTPLCVVPLLLLLTLLFLLGWHLLQYSLLITKWPLLSLWFPINKVSLIRDSRSKLGKGMVRGKGERNTVQLCGGYQINSFLSISPSQQNPSHARGTLHGFSFPLSLPNILAICFGCRGGVWQHLTVFLNQAHQHCVLVDTPVHLWYLVE